MGGLGERSWVVTPPAYSGRWGRHVMPHSVTTDDQSMIPEIRMHITAENSILLTAHVKMVLLVVSITENEVGGLIIFIYGVHFSWRDRLNKEIIW